MRLLNLTSSALAAASLLTTGAAAQDGYVTSISTYTITRTVERVVQTTYPTLSSSTFAPPTDLPLEPTFPASMASSASSASWVSPVATASMMPLPHYNGTKLAPSSGASGALYSSTASMSSSVIPQATGNAAARTGSESFTFTAIAGIIGLVLL